MAWIVDYQRWLSESESLNNAQEVANHFSNKGWTAESISALCGNMRHESSINPDMYEYGYDWSADRGYGLVQWTPRSKYWNWATQNNKSPRTGQAQLDRIDYEVENNIQWITVSPYMSFKDFRENSGDWSVDFLTEAFTWCYERPNRQAGQNSMADRKAFANKCFNELNFSGGGGDGTGRQLAVLPIDYVDISQGEYGSFTHYAGSGQELAIDFVFPTNQYPLYAPFDVEVMDIRPFYATVIWKNTRPVRGADGNDYDELHIIVIHDDFFRDYSVGDTRRKGEHFGNSGNETGGGGISTGDHFHFEVMRGHNYSFPPSSSNQLHIYDVFDTKHVHTWRRTGGYDWKESDFQDDDSGGSPGGGDSSDNEIIDLLLSNALNGWYN